MQQYDENLFKDLDEARALVKKQVDSFGASPVFGFTKWKFFLGVAKTYLSLYICGRWPGHYWKWHVLQFWGLLPIHSYRWWKMKQLSYFAELCWVMNASMCTVLPVWYFNRSSFGPEFFDRLCNTIFGFAAGPLAIAVPLFGNAIVPHSIDHTMALLIHLSPVVTCYSLRVWPLTEEGQLSLSRSLGQTARVFGFWEFFQPVLACLTTYTIFHSTFFLTYGLDMRKRGHRSSPADQLDPPKRPTVFSNLFGKLGSGGNDIVRYLKYEMLMYSATGIVAASTYPLHRFGGERFHMGQCVVVFASAIWNGAGWYSYNLKRLTSGLDAMIEEKKGKAKKGT